MKNQPQSGLPAKPLQTSALLSPSRVNDTPEVAGPSFYITASDRDLLAKLTELMRQRGYIGVADTAGRMQYILDGRKNVYRAAHLINELVKDQTAACQPAVPEVSVLRRLTAQVFRTHHLSRHLSGSRYLEYMLYLYLRESERCTLLCSHLYADTARHFLTTASRVERDVRYLLRQAGLKGGNARNLKYLAESIILLYHEASQNGSAVIQ
ncbi:MAG: sporulation initiation factor Spo0A C-terminal domain-containing protein [Oscillospiraceae bacterium]|nr:sporulation initiation factor Spo0A C-terminal domain-containing protein [Oscillospiraceae bacterium]MDD4367990.1 sporulation initiation factor Spo0A C-terminal domain-containing protein [Oscillospiraceae bacterium]